MAPRPPCRTLTQLRLPLPLLGRGSSCHHPSISPPCRASDSAICTPRENHGPQPSPARRSWLMRPSRAEGRKEQPAAAGAVPPRRAFTRFSSPARPPAPLQNRLGPGRQSNIDPQLYCCTLTAVSYCNNHHPPDLLYILPVTRCLDAVLPRSRSPKHLAKLFHLSWSAVTA